MRDSQAEKFRLDFLSALRWWFPQTHKRRCPVLDTTSGIDFKPRKGNKCALVSLYFISVASAAGSSLVPRSPPRLFTASFNHVEVLSGQETGDCITRAVILPTVLEIHK